MSTEAADQLKYVGEKSAEPSATFPSAGFFGNQVSLTYDSWGRVTGDTQQWDRITSKLSRVDYVYSGANWQPTVTNVTYAGASALQSQTTTSYNLRGEVTSIQQKTPNPFGSTVTEPSGFNLKTVTYQRDLLGRTTEIQRSFKAGTSSLVTGPGTGIGYDGAGRIDDITHSLLGTGVIAGYEFTYDADSRITSIDSHVDGLMSYTYDNTHQLNAVTYSTPLPKHPSVHVVGLVTNSGGSVTGESFAYDANGNNSALTVSDDNIVTSDGTYSYVYDEEGRPITRTAANGTVTTYTWDHRGRLVKVEETLANSSPSLGASAGTVVTFSYDPLDRRIGKFVQFLEWRNDACFNCWQPNPEIEWYVQPAGGLLSYYVYDGQHISLELRSVTNESQATSDVYRRIMHGVAIDEVLAEETAWGTSWALSDHLGTIHDWVDATTGTSTHYVYSAFGRILSIDGGDPSLDTHLFGFTGRETDADTLITDHWMYYRARYYNPSNGRFVSQDPIGFAAGDANLYRYVGNWVTGATDPSGLDYRSDFINALRKNTKLGKGVDSALSLFDVYRGKGNSKFWEIHHWYGQNGLLGDWIKSFGDIKNFDSVENLAAVPYHYHSLMTNQQTEFWRQVMLKNGRKVVPAKPNYDEVAEFLKDLPKDRQKSIYNQYISFSNGMKDDWKGFYFTANCSTREFTTAATNAWKGKVNMQVDIGGVRRKFSKTELQEIGNKQDEYKKIILDYVNDGRIKPGQWVKRIITGLSALGIVTYFDSARAIAAPTASEIEVGKTFYSRFYTCLDSALHGKDVTQPVHDLAHSAGEFSELLGLDENYRKVLVEQIQLIPYR